MGLFNRRRQDIAFFIILVMVLGFEIFPQQVQAQDGIQVQNDWLVQNFPNTIEFHLTASGSSPIQKISLVYGTNGRSCQSSGSRQQIQFEAAEEVDVDWEWELKRSGAIPPGVVIWWEWHLTDNDGNQRVTDRQEMVVRDERHDWRSTSRDGVSVNWFLGDEAFGEEALEIALDSLARLGDEMGVVPDEEIRFWLYPTADDVREAIVVSSEWAGAVAFGEYNTMIVSLAPGQRSWAEEVFPHELTHVVVGMVTFNCRGGRLPVWLSEGLAVYGEGLTDQAAVGRLENALAAESLPPLKSLANGFSAYGDDARQAYSQSGEAVRYLIEQFGPDDMADLLASISDGMIIDDALESVYGFDTNGLDASWRGSLGYAPTPTAVGAQLEATPTLVPTIALVNPMGLASATMTPLPADTPEPAQTSIVQSTASPTEIVAEGTGEVIAVVPPVTMVPDEGATSDQELVSDFEAGTNSAETAAGEGPTNIAVLVAIIGVVVLGLAGLIVHRYRK